MLGRFERAHQVARELVGEVLGRVLDRLGRALELERGLGRLDLGVAVVVVVMRSGALRFFAGLLAVMMAAYYIFVVGMLGWHPEFHDKTRGFRYLYVFVAVVPFSVIAFSTFTSRVAGAALFSVLRTS